MKRMYYLAQRLVPIAVTLSILGVDFGDVKDFFMGAEFRALLAQILTQVTSGVADAVVETVVLASFGAVQ
jgi:hypothetical protein